jgi:uncharacterized membrane protein
MMPMQGLLLYLLLGNLWVLWLVGIIGFSADFVAHWKLHFPITPLHPASL